MVNEVLIKDKTVTIEEALLMFKNSYIRWEDDNGIHVEMGEQLLSYFDEFHSELLNKWAVIVPSYSDYYDYQIMLEWRQKEE